MTDISFGSTFRIPVSQPGVNAAKKAKLKELILSYPNGLIGKSKLGNARVSMANTEDANFIAKLKQIGYKVYQRFEGENIDSSKLDVFIKSKLDNGIYNQKGKSPKRLQREVKEKRRYERSLTKAEDVKAPELIKENVPNKNKVPEFISLEVLTEDDIRKSDSYLRLVEKEGKEFAEAVFFGLKK